MPAPAAPGAGWPVVGHAVAVAQLRPALATGRLAHAYLFAGPPQVGKATLARLFAQALVCRGDPAALDAGRAPDVPCGRCRACRDVARGTYPDLDWYSLARQAADPEQTSTVNKELSIQTVRQLHHGLSLRPFDGAWRLAVVEDAETLSLAAANALLKTLEEPPPYAVLVLLAADPGRLPPTILSRVQLVALRALPRATVAAALEARGVPATEAATLAALSGGRPGWAFQMAADPDAQAARAALLDDIAALPTADLPARFTWAGDLAGRFSPDRAGVFDAVTQFALWWRDLLVVRLGRPALVQNVDRRAALDAQAPAFTPAEIGAVLAAATAAQERLEQNVSPRLTLEELMLALPAPSAVR